jgi:hypothetical protein
MERLAVIDRVGFWEEPAPLELSAEEYLARGESYFGTVVTIRDVTVTVAYASASGGSRISAAETAQGVEISAELYRIPDLAVGTQIARLTGVSGYFYSDFLAPRSADDVELAAP